MSHQFSDDEIKEMTCLQCGADPMQPCTEGGHQLLGFHKLRIEIRSKMPALDCPLDSTDKAIIIGYAFVALCNSVAANSMQLFKKEYSSVDLQRTFTRAGYEQAMADGFIGPEKAPKGVHIDPKPQQKVIDPICSECNRPKSHKLHDKNSGDSRYHEFKEGEHISNRHERRGPDYKNKFN